MPFSKIFAYTAFIGALILVAGLSFSPAMQSIGVALIFLHPFLNGHFRKLPKAIWGNPKALLLILYYLITLLSFFYTDDRGGFWKDVQIKLPLLLAPIGLVVTEFTQRQWRAIVGVFVLAVFAAASGTLIDYFANFEYYNAQFLHAKSVPVITGVFHIYFGILLAFAAVISLYVSFTGILKERWQQTVNYFVLLIMLLALHTVAARTGLVAFYIAIFLGIVMYIFHSRKYVMGVVALIAVVAGISLALNCIPALKQKVVQTKTDIEWYLHGETNWNYQSIATRLEAMQHTWNLYKKYPMLGVGPADLDTLVKLQYIEDGTNLLPENHKLPHNQFLETLTTIGIAGELVLLLMFIIPLFKRATYSNYMFLSFLVIMFFGMQVESMLERQVGVTFFCFFYLMLNRQRIKDTERLG